jgi:hypothetical protein
MTAKVHFKIQYVVLAFTKKGFYICKINNEYG